jgi:predicted phage gp36 major capsid-like protein
VGIRTSLQITVLSERYADTGQVGFLAWFRATSAWAALLRST